LTVQIVIKPKSFLEITQIDAFSMDRDTKSLVSNDELASNQEPTEAAWVAVEVKRKEVPSKPSDLITNNSGASSNHSLQKSIPMKIQSTSGNPMGYDLAFGSPPIQDSQLVERLQGFQGESLAHFQQGNQSPNYSVESSTQQLTAPVSPNSMDTDGRSRSHLTVPVYQGGFGTLRPGFAAGRNDLTFSVTANYYGDADPHSRSYRAPTAKSQVRQKKRIPYWLRFIILKIVGVKTSDNDSVLVGTFCYILTLALGLLYVVIHTLFLGYNAVSSMTTLTTIEASLQIGNCLFGTSLGVYANRMAVKLFGYQKLIDSIRMHTKSVFKIRASTWAMLLLLGFISADFYDRYMEILVEPNSRPIPTSPSNSSVFIAASPNPLDHGYVTSCENLELPSFVCILDVYTRLAFSTVAGIWNLLVLIVILSICRTHTVGIRRFIRELEADGKVIENHYRSQAMDANVDMFSIMMNEEDMINHESDDEYDASWQESIPKTNGNVQRGATSEGNANNAQSGPNLAVPTSVSVRTGPRPSVDTIDSNETRDGRILSVNDILLRYWSINSRLCFTGLVVQRWVTCWIIFVVLWVAQMIVYWIRKDTRIQEVFLVAIPLVLLPLVCSALSEVNFEGDRVIRRLCPTSERLDLLLYLKKNPLHLTIYGQTVRFGNMSNGLIGLATALFTGIAINKFMKSVH